MEELLDQKYRVFEELVLGTKTASLNFYDNY